MFKLSGSSSCQWPFNSRLMPLLTNLIMASFLGLSCQQAGRKVDDTPVPAKKPIKEVKDILNPEDENIFPPAPVKTPENPTNSPAIPDPGAKPTTPSPVAPVTNDKTVERPAYTQRASDALVAAGASKVYTESWTCADHKDESWFKGPLVVYADNKNSFIWTCNSDDTSSFVIRGNCLKGIDTSVSTGKCKT
jgi:hypothetical protein